MRYARAHNYTYVRYATPKFDTFLNEAQYCSPTPMMEESTPSRPRTTYRKYLWDPSTPVPHATLYRHQKRTTASAVVDEGKSQCFV